VKRAGGITGYYAVRADRGWALYKRLPLARLRATAERHGCVAYMTTSDAAKLRIVDGRL